MTAAAPARMNRPLDSPETLAAGLRQVDRIAWKFRVRLPSCVSFDDLIQAGRLGLVEAASHFDASRGLQFNTFAEHRICGAIGDFLRRSHPAGRSGKNYFRESVDLDDGAVRWLRDPGPRPDELALDSAASEWLWKAVARLSARQGLVILLRYRDELQFQDIADELGVVVSRAYQIHSEAVRALREMAGGANVD